MGPISFSCESNIGRIAALLGTLTKTNITFTTVSHKGPFKNLLVHQCVGISQISDSEIVPALTKTQLKTLICVTIIWIIFTFQQPPPTLQKINTIMHKAAIASARVDFLILHYFRSIRLPEVTKRISKYRLSSYDTNHTIRSTYLKILCNLTPYLFFQFYILLHLKWHLTTQVTLVWHYWAAPGWTWAWVVCWPWPCEFHYQGYVHASGTLRWRFHSPERRMSLLRWPHRGHSGKRWYIHVTSLSLQSIKKDKAFKVVRLWLDFTTCRYKKPVSRTMLKMMVNTNMWIWILSSQLNITSLLQDFSPIAQSAWFSLTRFTFEFNFLTSDSDRKDSLAMISCAFLSINSKHVSASDPRLYMVEIS